MNKEKLQKLMNRFEDLSDRFVLINCSEEGRLQFWAEWDIHLKSEGETHKDFQEAMGLSIDNDRIEE